LNSNSPVVGPAYSVYQVRYRDYWDHQSTDDAINRVQAHGAEQLSPALSLSAVDPIVLKATVPRDGSMHDDGSPHRTSQLRSLDSNHLNSRRQLQARQARPVRPQNKDMAGPWRREAAPRVEGVPNRNPGMAHYGLASFQEWAECRKSAPLGAFWPVGSAGRSRSWGLWGMCDRPYLCVCCVNNSDRRVNAFS
jgi:hypothetical protein